MTIAVCWKWVTWDADGSPDDARWAGVSEADRAALEVALQLAGSHSDPAVAPHDVIVVTLGPAVADAALRAAVAAGASGALRIDAPTSLRSDAVAAALADVVRGSRWVICGDYSIDRGSGSVPALLAAHLDAAQALGLTDVRPEPHPSGDEQLVAVRRLDGGRRERLRVQAPGVLSVEGSVARLRRSSLTAELAADRAPIAVVPGPIGPLDEPVAVGPFRPRARVVPPPSGSDALSRVRALTESSESAGRGVTVEAPPAEAAARIITALRDWGELVDLSRS